MTNVLPTLVCFAVAQEARYFQKRAKDLPGIEVLLTGMGERNAIASVAAALRQVRPALVLTAGFAGGLVPQLERGAVVFHCDPETGLEQRLLRAGAQPVRFHCSNRVVTTAVEKRALHASTGAEAVEMESGCIHRLCRDAGIPAATVRVILDTAEEDLVLDFNRLMKPDQRLDAGKLGLTLLKSPGKIRALLQLQRDSAAAAQSLGEVLLAVLHQ